VRRWSPSRMGCARWVPCHSPFAPCRRTVWWSWSVGLGSAQMEAEQGAELVSQEAAKD